MIFPKIETLFKRDETFKVIPGFFKDPAFEMIGKYRWSEKLDGMNVRCVYQKGSTTVETVETSETFEFTETTIPSSLVFGGRSDNTQFPPRLLTWLQENITIDKFEKTFGEAESVILYGEGIGPGIQKVGNLYGDHQKFVLFDILIDGHWLKYSDVQNLGHMLGIDTAKDFGVMSIEDAVDMVKRGITTWVPNGAGEGEGLVGRAEGLYDRRGNRIITKLKRKDFFKT